MKIKVTASLLDKLIDLMEGKYLPSSSFSTPLLEALKEEACVVVRTQGSRKVVRAVNDKMIRYFATQRLNIKDLVAYRKALIDKDLTRADWVELTGDSKTRPVRGWKGFPLAALQPITAMYDDKPLHLVPKEGMSFIIHEYEKLIIPEDVTVIGIENGENFMYLERQRAFFERYTNIDRTLFVCRYPQNGDIANWLADKPNRYIHFGDLDIAGLAIYQNEFFKKLGTKASFLIPEDYEARIKAGNPNRFDDQFKEYGVLQATDLRVQPLLDCIYLHHKGYDQEGFIIP